MRLSNVGQIFFSKTRNNFVSLGHSRLSIIDLSANANQPFISNDGKYSIVYNGEIYNYKSIKTELEKNLTQNLEPLLTQKLFLMDIFILKMKYSKNLMVCLH